MIKVFPLLLFFMLFLNPVLAQTNWPEESKMCSYEEDRRGYESRTMNILQATNYPWGVCPEIFTFFGVGYEFIEESIHHWNTAYRNYIQNKYGSWSNVYNEPNSPLFTMSCDDDKHNIIYIKGGQFTNIALANYEPQDTI